MAENNEKYNGSVPIASGLIPYNEQDYPLVEAHSVLIESEGIRLDEKLESIGDTTQIENTINEVLLPLKNKVEINTQNISTNTQEISGLRDAINTLTEQIPNKEDFEDIGRDHRIIYAEEESLLYLYIAADEEEENTLEALQLAKEEGRVLAFTEIKGGGGGVGADTATPKITPITPLNLAYLYGTKVLLEFDFTNTYSDGEISLQTGSLTVTVDKVIRERKTISPGTNTIDVSKYLTAKNGNKVQLSITNEEGRVSRTVTWNVDYIDLTISSSFPNNEAYYDDVNISYSFKSSIEKTIFLEVDGRVISERNSSNMSGSFLVPKQNHGDHIVRIWAEATINEEIVKSNILFYDIIWAEIGRTEPIIRCDYDGSPLEQYSNNIFKYSVYNPLGFKSTIDFYINGENVGQNIAENSVTYQWIYKPTETTKEGETVNIKFQVGDTIKEWDVTIVPFPYDIEPITDGLMFDFNPIGRSNAENEGRDQYEYNGYKMIVSDNFDWFNGGWQIDDNGVPYFLIKRGSHISFDYKLYADDVKNTGKNYKIIFKAFNSKVENSEVFECCVTDINGNKIGVEGYSQSTYFYNGTSVGLDDPYADDEIVELEFNIQQSVSEDPTKNASLMTVYHSADPCRARAYDSAATFNQYDIGTPQPVTFGSDYCDVALYRFKAYNRSLTMDDTFKNWIADSLTSTEMADRVTDNDFLNEDGTIDYEKLSILRPDLRIILISCPQFTTGKSNKVSGCTVQQIMGNGDPYHNWTAENVIMKGQGTSSNAYGVAGRNIDLSFKSGFVSATGEKFKKYSMTTADMVEAAQAAGSKIKYSESVPVNYINIKVNIASSENCNNAMFANEYNYYQPFKRPVYQYNSKVRDTMEFHPCVVFVQETGTSPVEFLNNNYNFYACGDFGNSKKNSEAMGMLLDTPGTDNISISDKNKECIIEVSNNISPQGLFKKGTENIVLEDGTVLYAGGIQPITYSTNGTVAENTFWSGQVFEFRYPEVDDLLDSTDKGDCYSEAYDTIYNQIKTQVQTAFPDKTEEEVITLVDQEIVSDSNKNKISQLRDQLREANRVRVEGMVTEFTRMWDWVQSTDYSDDTDPSVIQAKKDKFTKEYANYFSSNSILYHYLFTERHTMIDNRAKNTFIHYDPIAKKWDYVFNYDNDTADGNDNSGNLIIPYGKEDTDKFEGSDNYIFNGATSVLWCNVRDCLQDQLVALAKNEQDMFNGQNTIDVFNEYQDYKPTRLEMMDMYKKYVRPYEGYAVPVATNQESGWRQSNDYLKMMWGRKTLQRKRFELYQNQYMNAKYTFDQMAGSLVGRYWRQGYASTSPLPTPEGFEFTPFADTYATVAFDGGYVVKKRVKAGQPVLLETLKATIDNLQDSNIYFTPGGYLTSLGNLAPFYLGFNDFSSGVRLQELSIGSDVEGYVNNEFQGLSVGDKPLLEKLDLRNTKIVSGFPQSIDTSKCPNLKEFYSTGSNVGAVTFANGALLEIARLNAVSSLIMQNLIYLKEFYMEGYENLISLTYQNCNEDAIDIVNFLDQAINLRNIKILDVDWKLRDSSLLNRLSGLRGVGSDSPILTGKIYLNEVRQSELDNYDKVWPNRQELEITYKTKVTQYKATFKNYDGSILYEMWVDANTKVYDPVNELKVIPEPTKPSSEQYSYKYSGWDTQLPDGITGNMEFIATYTSSIRCYKVIWYEDESGYTGLREFASLDSVPYGEEAVCPNGIPTKASDTDNRTSYLFKQWDKPTGSVKSDMKVYPVWEKGVATANQQDKTSSWTAAQFKNLVDRSLDETTLENYLNVETSGMTLGFGYFPDYSDTLGDDSEQILVSKDNPFIMTGSNYLNTGVQLFDEDKDWTLAIDLTFDFNDNQTNTYVACCNSTMDIGLSFICTVRNNVANAQPMIKWGGDVTSKAYFPRKPVQYEYQTNDEGTVTKRQTPREIVVLRHKKGDPSLYYYINNREDVEEMQLKSIENSILWSGLNYPLSFGAEVDGAGNVKNRGKGIINFAKIWWEDLGSTECKNIARWICQDIPMRYVGTGFYTDATSTTTISKTSTASFIMDGQEALDILVIPYVKLTTDGNPTGGWKYSNMRTFLTNKIYPGLGPTWQQLLLEVQVRGTKGGKVNGEAIPGTQPDGSSATSEDNASATTKVLISNDKLYAPSAFEINKNLETFTSESIKGGLGEYPGFTTNNSRVKLFPTKANIPYPWPTRSISGTAAQIVSIAGVIGSTSGITTGLDSYIMYQDNSNIMWTPDRAQIGVIFGCSI